MCLCVRRGGVGGVNMFGVVFLLCVFVAFVGGCVAAHPSPNLRERERE